MEDRDYNRVIIELAFVFIVILGLNVYRTETTKKEVAQLTASVELLSAQLDSIGSVEAPVGSAPSRAAAGPAVSKKDFSNLSQMVTSLGSKVTALQGSVDQLSRAQSKPATEVAAPKSEPVSKPMATAASIPSYGKVSVTAKAKVENRVVSRDIVLPKVSSGPSGTVVINVSVNRIGMVGSVSVNSASSIKDEDIIDLCKEAALRTDFAFNPEAPHKSNGTIIYTFTTK